jgi:hypothetical protein
MLRQLEQIPYVKDLVKRLRRNPYLRKACGYQDRAPCEAHFSQMKKRIGVDGFRIIEAWLRREALRLRRSQPLSAAGLVQAACIEGFPLGHVEAPLNVNEKQLVEELLLRVLGECIEVELLAADSQFESQAVFDLLDSLKIGHIIAWRRLKSRENPADVLTVKDRIDVEGPEWMRVVYKRLRAVVEGFNGRVKSRLAYQRLTWQGLGNASIHVRARARSA